MTNLHWPLPATNTNITTRHGAILLDKNKKPYAHIGIDISCEVGTPVYAAHDGTVRYEWTPAGGTVARLIGSDYYTRYAHLSSYTADDGERVQRGAELARSGNTGSATTGAHLHFAVHLPNGVAIDPLSLMEVPVIGKLSLHFQETRDWAADMVARYWDYHVNPASWVKAINPPIPDMFPNTHVLGRAYWHNDNNTWETQCIERGHAGGEAYFAYLLPYYQARKGIVTAWEAVNEPNLTSVQAAYNYADFLNSWRTEMQKAGFRTCGGSIGVGNPRLAAFGESNDILAIIIPALTQCDYWSYHAYWDGRYNPADNWWAHRYRLIVDAAVSMGYTLPPLILSECGCDKGGGKLDGWRARMSWEQHWQDLNAFSAELDKDSYVVAATLFTAAPNSDWAFFEYDQAQAESIGKARLGEPAPALPHEGLPSDETATDARTLVQKSRYWLEEEQRQREAGNTAYAERIRLALIQLLYRAEQAF